MGPMVRPKTRLADLGSGAGLPGLILAIACSELQLMSIEPVGKKCAFQQQVAAELALTDFEIIQKRAEQVQAKVDLIVSRALTSLADLIQISSGLIGTGVPLLAMKGRQQEVDAELQALPAEWSAEVIPVWVPGLKAERHLVLLNRP
jgi:16S rRNA (guanine527-N7)-methyltransferase